MLQLQIIVMEVKKKETMLHMLTRTVKQYMYNTFSDTFFHGNLDAALITTHNYYYTTNTCTDIL